VRFRAEFDNRRSRLRAALGRGIRLVLPPRIFDPSK